ncbi:MAG TPA: DHA2 family efflux MFS transporter permease subunit [Candidatus Limnocylindria bacterium]|jgi:EmrB/QacA subfamily drug resistance transporter|nr:DHA2 family efflux MFS transporter permease subunit [Candidatus Limnocylindria bacterium]
MDRPSRGWTLAITSIAFFMVALDSLVVVTALPAIQRDLGADFATLEWTVNAFTLAFAAGIITAAALGDRFGRRRIFALGLVVFTAASAACALAPSPALLIAARTVQGIGAAMVMPLSLTILTSVFPPERRATIVGIWGGIGGLAIAGGPLVGGAITQGVDWHWIFWVNVPIGIVAVALAYLRLPESRGPATRFDLVAAGFVAAGATALVWGLIRAGESGWSDAALPLSLGIAFIAAFVGWEARAAEPMLPLRLFRSRPFAAAIATVFLMTGALFSAAFLIAQYMQIGLGYSPFDSGLRVLPWTATPLLIAPLGGFLSDRVGRRPILVLGVLMQGIGLGAFALIASTATPYAELVVPLLVAGVGISLALPVAPTVALSAVAPHDIGKASGVNSTMQRFGSAFAIAIASAVFTANGHFGTAASFTAGFNPALEVSAALSVLGAITALGVGSTAKRAAVVKQAA